MYLNKTEALHMVLYTIHIKCIQMFLWLPVLKVKELDSAQRSETTSLDISEKLRIY